MNFSYIRGKNWIFKKFNYTDIKKYTDIYSLSEIVAKLLAIKVFLFLCSVFIFPFWSITDTLLNSELKEHIMYKNTNCFHLAIPCGGLETAKKFYSESLTVSAE